MADGSDRTTARPTLRVIAGVAESAIADDHLVRAFLRAFEAARRSSWLHVRGPLPFRAWLLRIAVNLGKNHLRDAKRWRRLPSTAAEQVEVPAVGSAALERAQREVLTLRIDGELPFREIADTLGITENNAKVHFHHAAKKLRSLLGGES